MVRMLIRTTAGISAQTGSRIVAKTRLASLMIRVIDGKRPFQVSTTIPPIIARNMICRVLPSIKGWMILVGIIPKTIAPI